MNDFLNLLGRNRNYRFTWMGQIVCEIGDHFNTIAVFSLVMETTGSGLVVSGVMLARAIPMVMAGPLAGVVLDRYDRKRIMMASDVIRAIIALAFIATTHYHKNWLLYMLSALLMYCSPFFTSGRTSILPTITSKEELHAANSLTQTTQWMTVTIGTMAGGFSAAYLGLQWAFVINSFSFLFSAWCVSQLEVEGSFRPKRRALTENRVVRPWHEYREGLSYMKATPLILAIALVGVGWALGGGAAQILFTLFGELVFNRGPVGIGVIWGFAGIGLVVGGAIGHSLGKWISFAGYKRLVSAGFIVHGGAYVAFSQMPTFAGALFFIALSRVGIAVVTVLNLSQMLRHVDDEFRGRVFSTAESLLWFTMMVSMTLAGLASEYYDPRTIGLVAGVLSSTAAFVWAWANWAGKLPEPPELGIDPKDVEIHGEPTV